MKARDPINRIFYFLDKNLPFGASISCHLFQEFFNCLAHLLNYRVGKTGFCTNYLDDFTVQDVTESGCNYLLQSLLELCEQVGCPVSLKKTEWTAEWMTFLGILLDGRNHCLCIPEDKRVKALNQIKWVISKRKIALKAIQRLTGLLNFLNKALVPGRAFTHRIYAKLTLEDTWGNPLKLYHHITLDNEFLLDCKMWQIFLENCSMKNLCCPYLDLIGEESARVINFFQWCIWKNWLWMYFQGQMVGWYLGCQVLMYCKT